MSEQNRDTASATSKVHNKTLLITEMAIFDAIWDLTGALLNSIGPSVTLGVCGHLLRVTTVSVPRAACTTATGHFFVVHHDFPTLA